jgi:hypothetical protein
VTNRPSLPSLLSNVWQLKPPATAYVLSHINLVASQVDGGVGVLQHLVMCPMLCHRESADFVPWGAATRFRTGGLLAIARTGNKYLLPNDSFLVFGLFARNVPAATNVTLNLNLGATVQELTIPLSVKRRNRRRFRKKRNSTGEMRQAPRA